MITKNIKAYIENDTLELSEQINVYSGDGDISINMALVGLKYQIDQMYSDLKIVKPDGSDSVTSRLPVTNNILNFVITQTMIDESIEVGEHKLQIRLWDSAEGGNRVALPAFSFIANRELEGSNVILYTLLDAEDNELIDAADYSLLTTSSKRLSYTAEQIDDSVSKKHTHSNSSILDSITSSKVAEWNSKSDGGHTHTGYATTTDTTNLNNNKFDDVSISGAELSLKANGVVKKIVTLPTSGGTVEGHTHANKATLDNITDAKVLSWDNKSNFSGSYADLTNKPTIPIVTNDLTNTLKSNYDAAYTHSTSSHAPANAEQNVQADWNVTDTNSDAYIKNKPTIPTQTVVTDNLTSTSSTEALSANQGKILDDKITQNTSSLADITNKLYYQSDYPKLLENPSAKLTIPTYEGSGQAMHPKVLYFKNSWNGYKFWMAFTPYPNSNDFHENPSIVASNDGITWVVPNGLTNPLDSTTNASEYYNSDTHLVYREDLNRLECWYRTVYNSPMQEIIYRRTSTDGITWTPREKLEDTGTSSNTLISRICPIIIYDENKYKIWACFDLGSNNRVLRYWESIDGFNWVYKRDIVADISTHYLSHCDITKFNNKYICVMQMINKSTGVLEHLMYMDSSDNVTYSKPTIIVNRGASGQWDDNRLYRPAWCIVDNELWLYYSATKSDGSWGTSLIIDVLRGNILDYLKTENSYLKTKITEFEIRIKALEEGTIAPETIYGQIVLSKTTTTIIEGQSDTFTIKLDKSPTNNQIVTLSKNNADVTLDKTSLTFTSLNWNTAQTVTITVAEDGDTTNESCTINATSPNVTTKTLTVNITDNDGGGEPPSDLDQYLICDYSTLKTNADSTKNIWTDSKGTYDGTLNGFDYTAASGWTANGLKFDGINDYITNNIHQYLKTSSNDFSILLNLDINLSNLNRRSIFNINGNYLGLWISDENFGTTNANRVFLKVIENGTDNDLYSNVITNSSVGIVITKTGTLIKLYINKILIGQIEATLDYEKLYMSTIGCYRNSITEGGTVGTVRFDDSLYKSFKVLNKALTQEEINTL